MTLSEIMHQLEANGSEQTRKVLRRHGARDPFYGVKVEFLKTIQKKVKKNYELSKALYATGNSDAMYLAGLIADPEKMTMEDLQSWVAGAYWYMLSDYTVAWVASESRFALELALSWIKTDEEFVCSAGWATLGSYVSITPDEKVDVALFSSLLDEASTTVHQSKNRVRYAKNGFVIAVGTYVKALTDKALEAAARIGKVNVDMGGTSCKVPLADEYIHKVIAKGRLGKKRKRAIC